MNILVFNIKQSIAKAVFLKATLPFNSTTIIHDNYSECVYENINIESKIDRFKYENIENIFNYVDVNNINIVLCGAASFERNVVNELNNKCLLIEFRKKNEAVESISEFSKTFNLLENNLNKGNILQSKKIITNDCGIYDENYQDKLTEFCEIMNKNKNEILSNPKEEFRYFCYRYLDYIRCLDLPIIKQNNYYEAVLIEYRCLPHLEFLIRNCIHKLGSEWSQTIVCGNLNYEYMLNVVKNIDRNIKVIKTDYDNLTPSQYSLFLASIGFWDLFIGEKILIYQEDTFIFKNNIMEFIQWDYIGAPWRKCQNDTPNCVGNGGLSLRSKQTMIDVIKQISITETNYNSSTLDYIRITNSSCPPEDVYFSKNMQELNIGKVADWDTACNFSSESILNCDSFGAHAMWNVYTNKSWKKCIYNSLYNKTCYIITNNFSGGSNKYLSDLIKFYGNCTKFVYLSKKNDLKKYIYNNNDIFLLQTLFFSDININDIINIKNQFNVKLFISIHDFYWINENILPNFRGNNIPWHSNYLKSVTINDDIKTLFKNANLVIHPTEFTYVEYAKYFDTINFIIINHNDIYNDNNNIYIPKIIDNQINIGCITSRSEYKGSELINYLYENVKHYKSYKINYQIFGLNLSPYDEDVDVISMLHSMSTHGLLFLNKYGETWSYALSKGLISNLPLFYNNFGSFKNRISNNNGKIVCFENEFEYYNFDKCKTNYYNFLDFIIENNNNVKNNNNNINYRISKLYKHIFLGKLHFKPNILIFGHVNFLNNSSGNEARIYRMILHLKKIFNVYYYLTNSYNNIECEYVYNKYKCDQTFNLNKDYIIENVNEHKVFNISRKYHFMDSTDVKNILNIVKTKNINVLVSEYIFNAEVFKYIDKQCLKIIDTHDKMSDKPINDALYISEIDEINVLNSADAILAITEEEECKFSNFNLSSNIILTKIDLIPDNNIYRNGQCDKYLFICATDNTFNVTCINEFISKCWNKLNLNIKLYISGSICSKISKTELDNVTLLGVLDHSELNKYITQSYFCLNPVYIGTGIKVKTLKYIENNKFVLGFDEAFKGLNYPIKIKDGNWDEYLNMLNKIINDDSLLVEINEVNNNIININSSDVVYDNLTNYIISNV
jgi:hypothetical protein